MSQLPRVPAAGRLEAAPARRSAASGRRCAPGPRPHRRPAGRARSLGRLLAARAAASRSLPPWARRRGASTAIGWSGRRTARSDEEPQRQLVRPLGDRRRRQPRRALRRRRQPEQRSRISKPRRRPAPARRARRRRRRGAPGGGAREQLLASASGRPPSAPRTTRRTTPQPNAARATCPAPSSPPAVLARHPGGVLPGAPTCRRRAALDETSPPWPALAASSGARSAAAPRRAEQRPLAGGPRLALTWPTTGEHPTWVPRRREAADGAAPPDRGRWRAAVDGAAPPVRGGGERRPSARQAQVARQRRPRAGAARPRVRRGLRAARRDGDHLALAWRRRS